MAQHAIVDQSPFSYSRADFAALRAWVQRVRVDKIAELYYADDAPQVARGLEGFLTHMRADLIDRAILANPLFAESLGKARLGGAISLGVLNILIKAADATPLPPVPNDLIAQWLRRKVAEQLIGQGIKTLAELKHLIESRGPTWWRSIPRIGQLRAQAIVDWMNRYAVLAISKKSQIKTLPQGHQLALIEAPLPLERISALPSQLDGSNGVNRADLFCYLQAKNDLDAIRDYLSGFRGQQHTFRAYQRELERVLLWSILIRKKPLSSLLVHDCEAYKDFLAEPHPALTGPRTGRFTPRWKPFVAALSPASQRQAVQIIRTAFSWLTSVRYLGGNPWLAVKDPRTVKHLHPMQIERALGADLWMRVLDRLQVICSHPEAKQARAGRAAILLMGGSGLRSSEAAKAKLRHLKRSSFARVAELTVIGKGDSERIAPVSQLAIAAIEEHWRDHLQSMLNPDLQDMALIRPLVIPTTTRALRRHEMTGQGYAPVALSRLAKSLLAQVADSPEFDAQEKAMLRYARAHDLRHTFATVAVLYDMPIDVTQRIMGHASLATTSIYVRAEQRRVATEAEKLFALQAARPSPEVGDNLVEKPTS